jgi:phospholipid transport system transporter-binding protein
LSGAGHSVMLILPATLTASEARVTQAMLAQALRQGAVAGGGDPLAAVQVDAAALKRFDSAALAVLLECQRLAQGSGKALAVRNAPAKLVALARLYGVNDVLSLSMTEGDAAASSSSTSASPA